MRRMVLLVASALPLVMSAAPTPSLALDRLPRLGDTATMALHVADLDRPARTHTHTHRHYHADAYWHWRYRAAYTRWMHNEHVRAGYPVRLRHNSTYLRADICHGCQRYRH